MKRLPLLYGSLAVILLLTAGLAWLLLRNDEGYTKALPQNPKALVSINLLDMATDAGMNLLDLIEDKAGDDSGISFAAPVYGFVTEDNNLGLLAKVSDADDLQGWLQNNGCSVERQRGLKWAHLSSFLLCFDDDKALAMGPVSPSDEGRFRNQMSALMKQDSAPSELYHRLGQEKGCARLITRLDIFSKELLDDKLPEGIDLRGVRLIANLNIERRAVKLSTTIETYNPAIEKRMSQSDEVTSRIQGHLLGLGPSDPLVWLGCNIHGEKILELLRTDPSIRTSLLALGMCIDSDMIIKSIDGDVSISIPTFDGAAVPGFLLLAELKSQDFLRHVEDWKSGIAAEAGVGFQAFTDHDFCISWMGMDFYFGVSDKRLYITNRQSLVSEASTKANHSSRALRKDNVRGSRSYVTFDVAALAPTLGIMAGLSGLDASLQNIFASFDRLNFKQEDSRHFQFELTTTQDISELMSSNGSNP